MLDYMRALQDRFDALPPEDKEMQEEAELLFHSLCSELARPEHKQLIRLVDIQDARREKTALNSFISGFKLAWGISRELTDAPPYSFEQEQEEQARKLFMAGQQRQEIVCQRNKTSKRMANNDDFNRT